MLFNIDLDPGFVSGIIELDKPVFAKSISWWNDGILEGIYLKGNKSDDTGRTIDIFAGYMMFRTSELMPIREAFETGQRQLVHKDHPLPPVAGVFPAPHPLAGMSIYEYYYDLEVAPKPDGTKHKQGDILHWNLLNAACKEAILMVRPDLAQFPLLNLFPFVSNNGTVVQPTIPPRPE